MDRIAQIWPTAQALAGDLQVPYSTAYSWLYRRRIPATRDLDLIEAARKRGHVLTLDGLARMRCGNSNAPEDAA